MLLSPTGRGYWFRLLYMLEYFLRTTSRERVLDLWVATRFRKLWSKASSYSKEEEKEEEVASGEWGWDTGVNVRNSYPGSLIFVLELFWRAVLMKLVRDLSGV